MPKKIYTLEEQAVKSEERRLKQIQHCKNWVAKNREKQKMISHAYYVTHKVEYNKKCTIYQRNRREKLKAENLAIPQNPESLGVLEN